MSRERTREHSSLLFHDRDVAEDVAPASTNASVAYGAGVARTRLSGFPPWSSADDLGTSSDVHDDARSSRAMSIEDERDDSSLDARETRGRGTWASAPGARLRAAALASVLAGACAFGSLAFVGKARASDDQALGRRWAQRGDWVRDDGSIARAEARPGGFKRGADYVRGREWAKSEYATARPQATVALAWLGGLLGFSRSISGDGAKWDPTSVTTKEGLRLPASFDARDKWPHCAALINEVVDQGNCGSCWAVAPAKVMSERLCIASHGIERTHLSGQQLLSCGALETPDRKAFRTESFGGTCDGGFPTDAYLSAYETGLVTGGLYGDKKSCMPYMFAPCEHPCEVGMKATCPTTCLGSKPVEQVYKIKTLVHCEDNDFDCMALEIYNNGPVSSYAGTIFDEFYDYKSGVYALSDDVGGRGASHGGHVVEVIGWGTKPNGVVYWKVFNSWLNWGHKGYGEIAVGEIRIGESVEAAIMLPHSQSTT